MKVCPRQDGKGRRAVTEILINTSLASDLIRKGEVSKLKELMQRSREQGMVTFDQSLFDLYEEGEISYQDALRLADSANEVRLLIKLHGTRDRGAELDAGLEGITLVDKED